MSSADLDQAELELGYTIVRSPLAGHISERHVDLGILVGPSGKITACHRSEKDTRISGFQHDSSRLSEKQRT